MTTSSTGQTTQLGGLSLLDDLNGLIHGKGGVHKIAPALDIVEQIAGLIGALFPNAAGLAGMVQEGAAVGESVLGAGTQANS